MTRTYSCFDRFNNRNPTEIYQKAQDEMQIMYNLEDPLFEVRQKVFVNRDKLQIIVTTEANISQNDYSYLKLQS